MITDEVLNNLELFHDPREWAFFRELRIGTGFSDDSAQRLDAYAIHYHPSKRNVTRTYELKVSRSDFKKELDDPLKRRAGVRLSHEFYFVTPKGLCTVEEIPVECGLMEVHEDGSVNTVIRAPFRDVEPPTWLFLASVCRRFDKPRLAEYMAYLEENKKLKLYGDISIRVAKEHIENWRNFSGGNKEIPDKIAAAIEELLLDIEASIEENRKIL